IVFQSRISGLPPMLQCHLRLAHPRQTYAPDPASQPPQNFPQVQILHVADEPPAPTNPYSNSAKPTTHQHTPISPCNPATAKQLWHKRRSALALGRVLH